MVLAEDIGGEKFSGTLISTKPFASVYQEWPVQPRFSGCVTAVSILPLDGLSILKVAKVD